MTPADVIRTMRSQAWERAKGELRSMEHTFYANNTSGDGDWEKFNTLLEGFIKEVEDNGLNG